MKVLTFLVLTSYFQAIIIIFYDFNKYNLVYLKNYKQVNTFFYQIINLKPFDQIKMNILTSSKEKISNFIFMFTKLNIRWV